MTDREKVIGTLMQISMALDMDGHHNDAQVIRDAIKMLKKQEARINELEEKLRLLEYGDQDTLQSAMMPAT